MLNEPESAAAHWPAQMVQQFSWRPVDWRWQRALQWSQRTDRRRWKDEDQWTQEAAFALRSRPAWYRPTRAIAARLHRIETAQQFSCDRTRQVLRQSWLLAGLSIADVAERMQELEEAVDWYERLFFDVRDRLHLQSAISTLVIGPMPAPGRFRVAQLLRQIAYFAGPHALSAAIPVLSPLLEGKRLENKDSLPHREQIERLLIDTESLNYTEWLNVLHPLRCAAAPTAPLGTGWRTACSERLSAAFTVQTPQSAVGQVRFA